LVTQLWDNLAIQFFRFGKFYNLPNLFFVEIFPNNWFFFTRRSFSEGGISPAIILMMVEFYPPLS